MLAVQKVLSAISYNQDSSRIVVAPLIYMDLWWPSLNTAQRSDLREIDRQIYVDTAYSGQAKL